VQCKHVQNYRDASAIEMIEIRADLALLLVDDEARSHHRVISDGLLCLRPHWRPAVACGNADAARRLPVLARLPQTCDLGAAHDAFGYGPFSRNVPVWEAASGSVTRAAFNQV